MKVRVLDMLLHKHTEQVHLGAGGTQLTSETHLDFLLVQMVHAVEHVRLEV